MGGEELCPLLTVARERALPHACSSTHDESPRTSDVSMEALSGQVPGTVLRCLAKGPGLGHPGYLLNNLL